MDGSGREFVFVVEIQFTYDRTRHGGSLSVSSRTSANGQNIGTQDISCITSLC